MSHSLESTVLGTAGASPAAPRTTAALAAPRCSHVRTSGARCGSPALRGRQYCYFHQQYRDCHVQDLPFIEDAHAVQLAIMQVLRALSTGVMEYKVAALMLYGLQTASANLRMIHAERDELDRFDSQPSEAESIVATEAPRAEPAVFFRRFPPQSQPGRDAL